VIRRKGLLKARSETSRKKAAQHYDFAGHTSSCRNKLPQACEEGLDRVWENWLHSDLSAGVHNGESTKGNPSFSSETAARNSYRLDEHTDYLTLRPGGVLEGGS